MTEFVRKVINHFTENEPQNSRQKQIIKSPKCGMPLMFVPLDNNWTDNNEYKQIWRFSDKEVDEKKNALAVNLKMCTIKWIQFGWMLEGV